MHAGMDEANAPPTSSPSARETAVAVGALAVGLASLFAALAPTAREGDPTVEVLTQVLLVLAVAGAVAVLASSLTTTAKGVLVALFTALFLGVGAQIILNANPFGLLGVAQDESYRTAYLTKFANGWGFVDYAYKGLPSFYPPLHFWVLGRLAALLGIPAWHMLKAGMLAIAFLVPLLSFVLWRPVARTSGALAVAVVAPLAVQEWYVPHLWVAVALFVPWWLHFVLQVGRDPDVPPRRSWLALGSVLGAVIAMTYWYPLVIGALQLVVLLALRRPLRRRGGSVSPARLPDATKVLTGTALLSAAYWGPLVVDLLTGPGVQTMQNRYFTADEVDLPFRFLRFDLLGLVLLFGLVWLLATARRSPLSLHLLGVVAAAYGLYIIGFLGFLADSPLDTVRTRFVIEWCLAAAAGLGAFDVGRLMLRGGAAALRVDARVGVPVCAGVAIVVVLALGQTSVRDMPFIREQRESVYPATLLRSFEQATRGRAEGTVVLTDVIELPTYLDVYVFNAWNAHYSHPAAQFDDRARFLTVLSHTRDPVLFAAALAHNRFDKVDFVAFRPPDDGEYTYTFLADAFPRGVTAETLRFTAQQFTDDLFELRSASSLTVYRVRHDRDPLRKLRDCPRDPSGPECAVLGTLARRFGPDLDDEAAALISRWRRARA